MSVSRGIGFFSLSGLVIFSRLASAEPHVHGQGNVFIAQENDQWQVQLILPAKDVLGFEHDPETRQEREHLHAIRERVLKAASVVELVGNCTLQNTSVELPGSEEHESHEEDDHHDHDDEHHEHEDEHHEHDDEHHEHDDEHHEHEDEHHDHDDEHHEHDDEHHEHDDEHQEEHQDVELTYSYNCQSAVTGVNFTLFDWLNSLETLDVQWFSSAGQGATKVNSASAKVVW